MSRKIKVLLAKAGLDPHDKGIKLVARKLREIGGMEVFYTGLYRSVDEIVEAALQERPDIVGLSVHTGMQMSLFPELRYKLNEKGAAAICLIGGGVIPPRDVQVLKEQGCVAEVFGPNQSVEEAIDWIKTRPWLA
ncbi:MAG: cobalamin-dependent protein [Syntrophomonadaceae bacterium]